MDSYCIKGSDSIQLKQILFLQAVENYTLFYLADGSKIMSSSTLKRHEEALKKRTFLRVSRSILINSEHIKDVWKEDQVNFIRMNDGREIQVSRRRRGMLRHIAN